jgi:glycosyltransferase involved in cell wall biosynthesis
MQDPFKKFMMTKMNVLILGIPYFEGMAGSMRVRNLVEPLLEKGSVDVSNLIFTKGKLPEISQGTNENIRFRKIHLEESSIKSIFSFIYSGCSFIRSSRKKNAKNILYSYDSPDIKSIFLLLYAKILGFKILYDIVEDNRFVTAYSGLANRVRIKTSLYIMKATPLIANSVIAISSHLEKRMRELSRNKLPVVLIPITVNFKFFSRESKESNGPVKIFYGGSFGEKDGLKYLIKGFEIVARDHKNVVLILTGKGEVTNDFNEIMHLVKTSAYAEQIDYRGYLTIKEYYEVLNECDVFCMTRNNSVYANAGFPFKLGEFLASGKAVIATNVGDVSTYLKDGVNALLIRPESADEIAGAINRIITQPSLIKQLGEEARKTADKHFNSDVLSLQLLKVFGNM